MDKIELIFKNIKIAQEIVGILLSLVIGHVPKLYSIIKEKLALKGWKPKELGETEERKAHLLGRTLTSSILGIIALISIIVFTLAITALIYVFFYRVMNIELSNDVCKIIILLISAGSITIFSLWFSRDLNHAPYAFCNYKMFYLLIYIRIALLIITPNNLQENIIYIFITDSMLYLWACSYYYLLLFSLYYFLKPLLQINRPINTQCKIALNNIQQGDEYILEALNKGKYKLGKEFLIVYHNKNAKEIYCKIPLSNVKKIEYIHTYNT